MFLDIEPHLIDEIRETTVEKYQLARTFEGKQPIKNAIGQRGDANDLKFLRDPVGNWNRNLEVRSFVMDAYKWSLNIEPVKKRLLAFQIALVLQVPLS